MSFIGQTNKIDITNEIKHKLLEIDQGKEIWKGWWFPTYANMHYQAELFDEIGPNPFENIDIEVEIYKFDSNDI